MENLVGGRGPALNQGQIVATPSIRTIRSKPKLHGIEEPHLIEAEDRKGGGAKYD
jgi:hypothetical protein